jgi:glutamate-5-semialdehyde dehydrogenase
MEQLEQIEEGMPVIYGGNKLTRVTADLAEAFGPGDRLVVVQKTGDLLHIPSAEDEIAAAAVGAAYAAFGRMGSVTDEQLSAFYEAFASRLEDESSFASIRKANEADVSDARNRGRTVTRLVLSEQMRADMVSGLRGWRDMPSVRGSVIETVQHKGWHIDQLVSGLGVVGFVFEGRPNVFADATGVLRTGNTVVFRIGSDALGTARALVEYALDPAIEEAAIPVGAVSLVESPSRATGWAMFSDGRLALAIARGSGAAVAQLGAVAAQSGIPVSLHGTGGAWIMSHPSADSKAFELAVYHSLDHKVCNTLNTCVIVQDRAEELVPIFLEALEKAGTRKGTNPKLHVAEGSEHFVPAEWFERHVTIGRAEGEVAEPQAELVSIDRLGVEWEWEDSPEVTLVVVNTIDEGVALFNAQSPKLAVSLIAEDEAAYDQFFNAVDAPFVGNGFTRWVDGQYALNRPELGLSNWEGGRLLARSGILSGDSIFTIRTRVVQTNPDLGR